MARNHQKLLSPPVIGLALLLAIYVAAIVTAVMHGEYERALTLVACLGGGCLGSTGGIILAGGLINGNHGKQ